jgi:hypothetical protein
MIIVKLMGGLGNQMFQYACGKAVAERLKTELKLDHSFLEDRTPRPEFTFRNYELNAFGINKRLQSDDITNSSHYTHYSETSFFYSPLIQHCSLNTYLEGYFQSERYFIDHAQLIHQTFRFIDELPYSYQHLRDAIFSDNSSIALHIRRGDYLTIRQGNEHPICSLSYYERAIRYLADRIDKPTIYVFSDDPTWVHQAFRIPNYRIVIVDSRQANRNADDLHLMHLCKHHILANSSFSWWGAWLANHPNQIVIGPERWFGNESLNQQTFDLFPAHWLRMGTYPSVTSHRIEHYLTMQKREC